jgi:hypothetical protein
VDVSVASRMDSTARFVRARAAWTLQTFSEAHFSSERVLARALHQLVAHLVNEKEELPVKVEAAIAIQMMLNDQKAGIPLAPCDEG